MEMRELGTRSFQATCPTGELMPSKRRSKWHDAVSHRAKAVLSIGKEGWVQPGSQPISISANRGFKTRLDGCPSGMVVPGWWVDADAARFGVLRLRSAGQSVIPVLGVGQCVIACTARYSPCLPASCVGVDFVDRFVFGDATGVAQNRACWSSPISSFRSPPRDRNESVPGVCQWAARWWRETLCTPPSARLLPLRRWVPSRVSIAAGVGKFPVREAEPSLAAVRGARFLRAEYVPFTIEPEDDQRGKDAIEESSPISGKDAWDVLKKDVSRLHFTDDPGNVVPDESLVVHSSPLAGEADGLAWESRSDEIHRSTPRPAVEGANVVPDRSVIQAAVLDSRRDDSCGELAPFDVADGADIGGKAQSEVESAHAGAQADGT
jgi:hypothetical protein